LKAEYEYMAEVVHASPMLNQAGITQDINRNIKEGWVLNKIVDAPPSQKVFIYCREKAPR
jgi:hypothetical protein